LGIDGIFGEKLVDELARFGSEMLLGDERDGLVPLATPGEGGEGRAKRAIRETKSRTAGRTDRKDPPFTKSAKDGAPSSSKLRFVTIG
jgi:hypothetical protein